MVDVPGGGSLGPMGGEASVPIASLAKIMTADVILRDHPLGAGSDGPQIAVTAADVSTYEAGLRSGESVVQVTTGESFTEYQLLEALLVPSADNAATMLAVWDAGSEPAFVAKMNAEATALGLKATHYADASGVSSATVSDATDQVHLAETAMSNVVFSSIVAEPQTQLPVVGVVHNYNSLVGTDGIIGLKTGSTTAAGGCFVFAARRDVGGRQVTVFGVVLGQRGGGLVPAALASGKRLVDGSFAALSPVVVIPAGQRVASVQTPWASPVAAVSRSAVDLVAWPGTAVRTHFVAVPLTGSIPAGRGVGSLTLVLGDRTATVVARTTDPVPGAPLSWKLRQL